MASLFSFRTRLPRPHSRHMSALRIRVLSGCRLCRPVRSARDGSEPGAMVLRAGKLGPRRAASQTIRARRRQSSRIPRAALAHRSGSCRPICGPARSQIWNGTRRLSSGLSGRGACRTYTYPRRRAGTFVLHMHRRKRRRCDFRIGSNVHESGEAALRLYPCVLPMQSSPFRANRSGLFVAWASVDHPWAGPTSPV